MTNGKIVYVLGAGFSKDAGCPLVSEFTKPSLINELKRKLCKKSNDLKKFKQVAHYIRDRIDDGYCDDNIESVLNHVATAKYLSMGSTTEKKFEKYSAEDIFTDVQWFILKVLELKTAKKIPPEYTKFLTDICAKQETIITFNYDLVLEKVLEKMGEPFTYGMEKNRKNGRLILKLHGSANWAYCNKCKIAVVMGPAVIPESFVATRVYTRAIYCPNCGSNNLEPVIIPPILYKDAFYQNSRWIRELWMKAYEELSTAQKIVFIGFSMAENDAYARELFKISSNVNRTEGLNYLVVNKSRSEKRFQELKKKYKTALVGENIRFEQASFLQYVREITL